jgi:hypothetical protein
MEQGSERTCSSCGLPPKTGKDGCTVVPLKNCSRCKQVWYHGVECQRKDFPRHRKECKRLQNKELVRREKHDHQQDPVDVVRVEEREGRGNCLVTTQDCERGHFIQDKFEALVPPVLLGSMRAQRCSVCFGQFQYGMYQFDSPDTSNNEKYYPVYLCSEECQRSSASWLRQEERLVAHVCNLAEGSIRIFPTAILLYRIVCAARTDPSIQAKLGQLQQHEARRHQSEGEEAHTNAVTSVARLLLRESPLLSDSPSPEGNYSLDDLAKIFIKIKTNSFSIADGESIALGVGLYPIASYANHSCAPNTLQTFRYGEKGTAPCLRLTLCQQVAANQEVCISYVDNAAPRRMRQQVLRDAYYFKCNCPRCQDDADANVTTGLRCHSCQTLVRSMVVGDHEEYCCPSCGDVKFEKAVKEITNFQAHRPARSITEWRYCFSRFKVLFMNASWYLQECGDKYLQALLDEVSTCKTDQDRMQLCHESLAVAEELLSLSTTTQEQQSSCRILRTTFIKYKRAKLLLFVQPDPRIAIGELQDCLRELLVFYPDHHEIIRGIKASLSQGMG